MNPTRRNFLKAAPIGMIGSSMMLGGCASTANPSKNQLAQDYSQLDRILEQPVLKKELFTSPVIIDRLELLRRGNNFICRVTSKDGAEGISVGNNMQMVSLYPIFQLRLRPFFISKDARDWESLLEDVYVHQSNYKLQGLALWIPLATIEFAVLDMLGKMVGKPMGELIGDIHNTRIAVYQANGSRGRSAEETIALIEKDVREYNAKALKFKVGGRMSKNAESPAGRTENLIPLVRKTFGDDMVIYADSNGSYTVDEGIRIGKIMEEYKYDFYEEPVPFDWYEETKMVADALNVPIAGGEQEPSMHNFRWLIQNNGLQIVQPDIFYFGGMIRSMKVARMADSKGMTCVPHISGSGLGYLYMMHFVSAVPNAGPYHEFKGFNYELPLECPTSSLESEDGVIQVPSGPGAGVEIDPDFIGQHKVIA